jgi:hypothetical protein
MIDHVQVRVVPRRVSSVGDEPLYLQAVLGVLALLVLGGIALLSTLI